MSELSNYILRKAKEAGICEEWAQTIACTDTVDGLLAMYIKGIDFCLEKNFPSNADLIRFGGNRLHAHGIYIDSAIDVPEGEIIVLLGSCAGILYANGYSAKQFFIKHQSNISVVAKDNAFIVMDCFDNAELDVDASGQSKVLINVYGSAKVTHTATDRALVKIVHKNKSSY